MNVRNKSVTFALPAGTANATMNDAFTNAPVALGATLSLQPYQYLAYVKSAGAAIGGFAGPAKASVRAVRGQGVSVTLPDDREYTASLASASGAVLASDAVDGRKTRNIVLWPRDFSGGICFLRLTPRGESAVTQKIVY